MQIRILRDTKQWVDPNLEALCPTSEEESDGGHDDEEEEVEKEEEEGNDDEEEEEENNDDDDDQEDENDAFAIPSWLMKKKSAPGDTSSESES